MADKKVRTRFAPSPTGFMHVGNLRTALYEYLVAKSLGGDFVLRIEDTDQERKVEGAVDVIYDTMKAAGLKHDEGPDIGGEYGPYVQSERKDMYLPYAEELIKNGHAYRCFCTKERLDGLRTNSEDRGIGYDRHCRNLSEEEINEQLAKGTPYVIRQKMPLEGTTTFEDAVFGTISVENDELQDQITTSSLNDTEVFRVFVQNPDPRAAARIANAIAEVAPDQIADIVEGSSVKIVDYAEIPTKIASPNYRRNAVIGMMMGMVLSAAVIVFRAMLDTSIRSEADFSQWEYPILSTIPDLDEARKKKNRGYGYGYDQRN